MNRSRRSTQLSLFDRPPTPHYTPGEETQARLRTLLSELLCQVATFEAQGGSCPEAAPGEERGDE
jgi:hypothetical protein